MYKAQVYGAKAASLSWLKQTISHAGIEDIYRVPKFKAYSITPPDHEGMIACKCGYAKKWIDNHFPNGTRFAVRSGSSTSLPGLMETKLNLSREEVPGAVQQIYKSFDRSGVREALKKIPSGKRPVGTGVVIQKMVEKYGHHDYYGDKQSVVFGVVFTVTGDGFPDLTFRYAGSPGEIVSNGEEIGTVGCHWGLFTLARRWEDEFGHPPEFEIAVVGDLSSPHRIHLLQARNQKLTNVEQKALDGIQLVPPEDEQPFLEFEGGGLAQIESMEQVEYLADSDPEQALRAVRKGAKLVLWRKGSPFSHAAVLCRSDGAAYGRAPFKAVMNMPLPPFTYFDGKVYFPKVELIEVPFEKEQTAAEDTNWDIINWMYSEGNVAPMRMKDINTEFVKSLTAYKSFLYGKSGAKCLLEFAQMLVLVGTMTCAGEMRHERNRRGLGGRYDYQSDRTRVWGAMLEGEFQPPIEWLRKFGRDFEKLSFKPGYGQKPWARIAHNAASLASALKSFKKNPTRVAMKEIDRMVSVMEYQEHNNSVYWRKLTSSETAWPILNKFRTSGSWDQFRDYVISSNGGLFRDMARCGLRGESITTRGIRPTSVMWIRPNMWVYSNDLGEPMPPDEYGTYQKNLEEQKAKFKMKIKMKKKKEQMEKAKQTEQAKIQKIDKVLLKNKAPRESKTHDPEDLLETGDD